MPKIKKNKSKRIAELIRSSNSFLITAHMNLEGDALGSELALYLLLKQLKKKVFIYNHDKNPDAYLFLPKIRTIKNRIRDSKFDVFFVLDCSDLSRTGKVKDTPFAWDTLVNIDHHISNTGFGDINWVEPKLSSTCEMIYYLAKELKVINKEIAKCLYTGIFTDSGSFTYASTSSDTHAIAADLMKFDLSPDKIYERVHSLCDPEDIRFIGKQISKLNFSPNGKICWAVISYWQEKSYDLTDVIFSIMRLLKEPLVFVLFKRVERQKIRINFRSRSRVDVNKIAKVFGGGGHKRASGTTFVGTLKEAENRVISFMQDKIDAKTSE